MKVLSRILILTALVSAPIFAEDSGSVLINVAPRGILPVSESTDYFSFGYGAELSFDYSHDAVPFLFGRLKLDYEYIPIITKDAFSAIAVSVGPGICYRPFETLFLSAWVDAGYFFGSMTDGSGTPGGNLTVSAGAALGYDINPAFSIALSGDYTSRFYLLDEIGITLSAVIHPEGFSSNAFPMGNSIDLLESLTPGVSGSELDIKDVSFNRVFPVLFKHYDDNPVGTVSLFNNEPSAITDASISFYVDRYMDNPKQGPVIASVAPGETIDSDFFALFSDNVLDITEGTKVSANIILKYKLNNAERIRKYTVSMDIYDRNAITWDDDRKAAAFVTARDPAVLEFAKNISGWVKEESPAAIDRNFCIAMGIHNGLKNYGINYQIDPKTPFTEFSSDNLSVDFLQFPRQTLSYSSGDCDDLSILYSALLESVGIETAFITVPGHIFMALKLNMSPAQAKSGFQKPEDLIIIGDNVWLPVEITLVQQDFLTAWAEGAKQWREYESSGKALLYPMHDSWKEYQPAGLPGSSQVTMPSRDSVLKLFGSELHTFIDRELFPKVEKLEQQIARSNNGSKYINRLGVLYAKYGQSNQAEAEFHRVLQREEYLPALINMGNLKYLAKDYKGALKFYDRARILEPENPSVLVAVARANHELENYGDVKEQYGLLREIDPELAEKFAYLELRGDEAARASDAVQQKEKVLWDEN